MDLELTEHFVKHFDHHDERLGADPLDVSLAMLDRCPVTHSDAHGGFWVVSDYENARTVLSDYGRFTNSKSVRIPAGPNSRPLPPLEFDPPDHAKYRGLLAKAFSPRNINALEPKIRKLCDMLIGRFQEQGHCDLIQDLAAPLPTTIFTEMMGLPVEDAEKFHTWATSINHQAHEGDGAISAGRVAVLPDGLSLRDAATIPQGVETARRAIAEIGVRDGETVLVNGAAGSVGSAAVQVLAGRGVTVIGTARPENHEYLRALGAIPIEYGDVLLQQLAAVAPRVDRAIDCGGRGFVRQILPVIPAQRVITVADFEAPSLGATITMGPGPLELFADSFRDVLPLAAQGRFATEIAAEFPLPELAAAQKMNEDGHFRGKIVVKVADLD